MQLYGRWSVLMLMIGIASIFITPVFIWEKVQQRQCCTFIPDVSSNMTSIHDKFEELLTTQQKENMSSSWNPWSWFFAGGWTSWLIKIGVILLFLILMLLSCCIIPMVKGMVMRLMNFFHVKS
ncbi:hypothetical protein GOODEAATRI_034625 [Goodea atripinnis]|uniref:Uncharacterized protein n=1 Tax=Goodea atripinnis TaxID=208336 RepID=A0ABV0Q3Y7_9TELE